MTEISNHLEGQFDLTLAACSGICGNKRLTARLFIGKDQEWSLLFIVNIDGLATQHAALSSAVRAYDADGRTSTGRARSTEATAGEKRA